MDVLILNRYYYYIIIIIIIILWKATEQHFSWGAFFVYFFQNEVAVSVFSFCSGTYICQE